jgi:hypothetical protein
MLTRIKRSAMALAAAVQLLGGCAGDDPDSSDAVRPEVGETSSAILDLGPIAIPDRGPIALPPRDPLVPRRPGLSTLHVNMATLRDDLVVALSGTRISLDATNQAPTIQSPTRVCRRDQVRFDEARAECKLLHTNLVECLRQAALDWPEVCASTPMPYHSYVAFPDTLKSLHPSLTDKVFDVPAIVKDSWAGQLTIRINQVHATLGLNNLELVAGKDDQDQPFLGLGFGAQSGSPTATCENANLWLNCPAVMLTHMHLVIRFDKLQK